jgi:hypothetical protein
MKPKSFWTLNHFTVTPALALLAVVFVWPVLRLLAMSASTSSWSSMFLSGASMTLPKKMFDNIMMEIDPTIAAVSVLQILLVGACLGLAALFGRGALATATTR